MRWLRILLYGVGRIAAAGFASVGFALDWTGGSIPNIHIDNWGKTGLVAFAVFGGLTLVREIDLLLQQRPNIKVTPEVHNGRALLEVHNSGAEADFTATARVIASLPEPELYTLAWEPTSKPTSHIDSGNTASILVGEIAKQDYETLDIMTAYLKGEVVLSKIGELGSQIFPVISGETIVERKDDRTEVSSRPIDKHIVEITITSTPKLKRGYGTHRYIIGKGERGELKFYEEDVNAS